MAANDPAFITLSVTEHSTTSVESPDYLIEQVPFPVLYPTWLPLGAVLTHSRIVQSADDKQYFCVFMKPDHPRSAVSVYGYRRGSSFDSAEENRKEDVVPGRRRLTYLESLPGDRYQLRVIADDTVVMISTYRLDQEAALTIAEHLEPLETQGK